MKLLSGKSQREAEVYPASVSRDTNRLVTFSDAVFAITVTLLVLEIRAPTPGGNLPHALIALWSSYLAYVVTFLFIGQVWVNHHVMFDHIRTADRTVLLLNTLVLMVVAFLPFATSVLAGALRSGHGERTAVVFYGIAFDLTALTFNAVWQYARRHRLLSDALDPAGAVAISRRFQLALVWLAAGALCGAALPVLGVIVIATFNGFYWLPIRGETPARNPDDEGAARRQPREGVRITKPFEATRRGGDPTSPSCRTTFRPSRPE
jgi:uncharacterized membrane protein